MQRLTENERGRVIGMLQNGSVQLKVALQSNVSQSVIGRLWNRHQQTENVTDLPHSWRPRSITFDRLIGLICCLKYLSCLNMNRNHQFHSTQMDVMSFRIAITPTFFLLLFVSVILYLYSCAIISSCL